MFRAKRSQLVELVIGAAITQANSRVYFQNQPQLQTISGDRTIYVKGISTYSTDTMSASPLSANTMATPADIINGVLVLSVNGEDAFNMIPLADLATIQNPGTTPWNWQPFLLKNVALVDWTKSYVQMITAPAAVPFSYIFRVFYDYQPDIELALNQNGDLTFTV